MTAAKPNRGQANSPGTHSNGMQPTALCAAADAER
jgi:hypothetical protein